MLSKPVPKDNCSASAPRALRQATAIADDIMHCVTTMWPSARFGGGCGFGPVPTHRATVQRVGTTVDGQKRLGGVRLHGAVSRSGGTVISTTVSEARRLSVIRDGAAKMLATVSELSKAKDCDSKTREHHMTVWEESKRQYVMRLAAQSFAPILLLAPLQLASPWSAIGLTAMAAAPGVGPPPAFAGMPGMPGMPKEEEQFMELIFPGFDGNAFVWQITCWQVAEFAFSMFVGHNKANPTPCALYALGASWGPAISRGQLWRLLTPVMLHANLTHLLFNVFFQLRMGFGMEKQFGRNKFMAIYFACGVLGNLLSVTMDPYKLAVGASTAGFGLIGVWLAEILLSWELLGPARERTVIWIVFMLISVVSMSTMTPNMDLFGHLGGALGGFLLSIVISDMREEDRPAWYSQVRVAAAIGLALCFTSALAKVLLINPHDPIPDCSPLLGLLPSILSAKH